MLMMRLAWTSAFNRRNHQNHTLRYECPISAVCTHQVLTVSQRVLQQIVTSLSVQAAVRKVARSHVHAGLEHLS